MQTTRDYYRRVITDGQLLLGMNVTKFDSFKPRLGYTRTVRFVSHEDYTGMISRKYALFVMEQNKMAACECYSTF